MKWIDGSEIDLRQFSGNDLCEKLAAEMWGIDREQWSECAAFLQNAMFLIDFDTVTNMEGFSTPYNGYFTDAYYSKIIEAFRAIGDETDADILAEASRLDEHYQKLLADTADKNENDRIYDEFFEVIDALGEKLYLNTGFDMWALLYQYLDEQIKKL